MVETSYTQRTTDSNPSMILSTVLVPGSYYNISITAEAGDENAAGGKKESVARIERIRTMVESKVFTVNLC